MRTMGEVLEEGIYSEIINVFWVALEELDQMR